MMMSRSLRTFALLLASVWLLPAGAEVTAIAQKPLIVANPDAVKANLLFILDDSGSMDFDFTPDHINSALCRSATTMASAENSGSFTSLCCLNGGSNTACFVDSDPTDKPPPRGQPPFLASGFNRQYYDPTVFYKPPVKADGTFWASQTTGATSGWTAVKNDAYDVQSKASINLIEGFPDTEWCTDAKDKYGNLTYADCLRNGNYVLPGIVDRSTVANITDKRSYTTFHAVTAKNSGLIAIGAPDAPTTETRKFGPHYYEINAAEFCSTPDLRKCQATADASYTIPAVVRWCNSDEAARATEPATYACQATRNGTFSHARFPTKFLTKGTDLSPGKGSSLTFKIVLSGTCDKNNTASVASLKINGTEYLSGTTAAATKDSALAGNIVAKFNTAGNWSAISSGATVTITAPVASGDLAGRYATLTAGSSSSKCKFTPTTNAGPFATDYKAPVTEFKPGTYAGSFRRVDIHPDTATYTRPTTRTDCAAIKASGTCTYAEEMTNFANWWTYYHSRMQAMKSGASLAFGDVGSNRRVGYLSINNATKSDFLNLYTFDDTSKDPKTGIARKHREKWFNKLKAAVPSGSTPLRGALSKAGRLFAGVLNGQDLYGSAVDDPVQYSCQRNATILSTDGFWNNDVTPTRPDGEEIGDVDSAAKRPMYDGKAAKNTLADTAYYYYTTDLRTGMVGSTTTSCTSGNSESTADVCGTDDPINHKQTMMTFTLGLGVSGYMQFLPDYVNAPDFRAITNETAADPGAGVCSWQTSGVCEWPVPSNNTLTAVDDLWHAAVNGGGTYFSAASPTDLYNGLSRALKQFDANTGASAAATTSNPNVTSGDNQAFVSNFMSSQWTGQLQSKSINLNTGRLDTENWSAQTQLDNATTRTIHMFAAGGTTNLKPFNWASMTDTERLHFTKPAKPVIADGSWLTQFCSGPAYCLSDASQALASGEALVEYLRGARTNEGELDSVEPNTKFFRGRAHVLGDIVNSEAVYVNKQLVRYADDGYGEFNARARTPMVYVGANDGMLHAFNATTGNETWAFVPTAVLPNMYKLADKQYATNHQYFVDATPVVQDIKIGTEWRTILVGGLGAGGRAYYALDITDPADPKALWEFTHDNLGLTFGQPEIGKLRNGTWVVVVASGYNNVSPGDGKGRLFVLDAATGKPVDGMPNGIATTAGDTTTPSGLAYIRGWLENSRLDNTIQRVYGGDNLGNVWRFDINDVVGVAGYDAQLLGVLKTTSGMPQPVTSRPELGDVNGVAMVYVGTGRYLGMPDLSDTTAQSVYAIKDPLTAAGHGEVRAGGKFVKQTLVAEVSGKKLPCPDNASWCTSGQTVRMSTSTLPVNLSTDSGWYVDLPLSRERVNTDPLLVLGTLVVISNVIEPGNLCKVGGSSWVNYFDYKTGQASSVALGDVLSSRPTVYRLPNGKLVGLARDSSGGDRYFDPPVGPQVSTTRRVSWRDLLQD